MLNSYFKESDKKELTVNGLPISQDWWSRHYEYPWAFQFAGKKQVVADMGVGMSYRPFKDALSLVAKKVYAVDKDNTHWKDTSVVEHIQADFTKKIEAIEDKSVDRVFCISVLEHLETSLDIMDALKEFKRIKTDAGMIVLTVDMLADPHKPSEYSWMTDKALFTAINGVGLKFVNGVDWSKEDCIYHAKYNLTVFHCVLT